MTAREEMSNVDCGPFERILQSEGVDDKHSIVEIELRAKDAVLPNLIRLIYNEGHCQLTTRRLELFIWTNCADRC